jgi:dTMP kinase
MIIDPSTFTLPRATQLFVVFEGINGCGKSTLLGNVSRALEAAHHQVITTREPGGTPLGIEIRSLLLDWKGEKKSPLAELLLFAADRAEHREKLIQPALSKGKTVLCDRYLYSTIAFQGYGRGLSREWIDTANSLATQGLVPDLAILMDLDPREGLQRTKSRTSSGRDAFEEEEVAFHHRIRDGFLEMAQILPVPFLILNGADSKEVNASKAAKVLGI